MEDFTKFNTQTATAIGYDAGLRAYMIKVFNYMLVALAVSGTTAYFTGTSPEFVGFVASHRSAAWIIILAPLVPLIIFTTGLNRLSLQAIQGLYFLYSVLVGISLMFIFAAYTQTDITRTFFITAATFGAMSLYGYSTKRDLTGMGNFLSMGVIGIFIALIANAFLKSSALDFTISIIGVLVFTALTAYRVQMIKRDYYALGGNSDIASKYAISSALSLYISFLNLFLFLLRLTSGGSRR